VRRLFVGFTQTLFSQAPPGHYHWQEDPQKTEIIITNENPINIDVCGDRPAISFTRGPVRFYSLGMDDLLEYRQDIDQKKKSVLVPGTMSINCCSKSDLESENLAFVVAEHFWLLRDHLIGNDKFFEVGRQPTIGSPTQAGTIVAGDQAEEWYATEVTIPFQFHRTSALTPLGKRIVAAIDLNLQTQRRNVVSRGYPQPDHHEVPVNLRVCPPESFAPDASDSRGGTPDPAEEKSNPLPKVPHPLDPARQVIVRSVRPNRPGLRPPSIGGAPIPIADPCVEESDVAQLSVTGEVKV
jgi:hypothetical protein